MKQASILASILLAGSLAAPAFAQDGTAALGASGEVYIAKTGTYKQLFPTDHATAPNNPVLAVDLIQSGAATQRLLVPYTKGSDVETSPAVLFEDDSNTLFVVWVSRINDISSVLMLASFDGAHWGPPIQITGNPFSSKSSPQLAINRDTFLGSDGSGNSITRQRTIVNVVWEEPSRAGNSDILYTPVILEEGTYLGWAPVYNLNDLVGREPSGSSFAPPDSLVQSPVLQSGRDARTLVVGFASAETRTLSSVEIDVLPEELSQLAEGARANIIDVGHTLYPSDRPTLAEKVGVYIISHGTAFHDDVIRYIADQVRKQIIADQGNDLVGLSEGARANIIDVGARLSDRGLRERNGEAKSIIERVENADPANANNPAPAHLLHFRVASSRPIPEMGANGVRVFLSDSGEDALVAWTDPGKVLYRLSQGNGWGDQRQIKLSDSLDLEKAYNILKQRVRNR